MARHKLSTDGRTVRYSTAFLVLVRPIERATATKTQPSAGAATWRTPAEPVSAEPASTQARQSALSAWRSKIMAEIIVIPSGSEDEREPSSTSGTSAEPQQKKVSLKTLPSTAAPPAASAANLFRFVCLCPRRTLLPTSAQCCGVATSHGVSVTCETTAAPSTICLRWTASCTKRIASHVQVDGQLPTTVCVL